MVLAVFFSALLHGFGCELAELLARHNRVAAILREPKL
jgi:hypothetical protein